MFAFKKNYFLIIENTKNFDLKKIKKQNKFTIIYRNLYNKENISDIKKFRNLCKTKKIMFFIANDFNLLISTNSDGIYISASNKSFKSLYLNTLSDPNLDREVLEFWIDYFSEAGIDNFEFEIESDQ